ncbi:MAG: hypothetical protein AB1813_04620 [Verrucomicrobiota bacterium]
MSAEPMEPMAGSGRGRRWLWLGLAGVILVAGLIGAKPAYRALKTWRAQKFAAQASVLMQQQKWEEAFRKAQAAYQLSPLDVETLRVVARLYSVLGKEQAFPFWEQLLSHPASTHQDRLEFVQLALRLRRLEIAEKQLAPLLEETPEDLMTLQLAAELFFLKRELVQALSYARKASAKQPGNQALQLTLSRLLLQSEDPADNLDGKKTALSLIDHPDQVGLEALVLAAQLGQLLPDEKRLVIDRLRKHPLATAEHRVLALDLTLSLSPQKEDELFIAACQEAQRGKPEELVAVSRWLNRHREFTRTIELISPAKALEQQDLFLVRLDALAALGQWKEIRRILEEEKIPIDNVLKQLYLARIARELNLPEEASLHWRRVHLEVGQQPQALLYIAQYAERLNEKTEAAKAYRRLTQTPALARQAYSALIRLAESDKNLFALRELMKELMALYPEERTPKNDLAYVNLLLNQNVEAALETAERLYHSNTNMLAFRTTLALAHLRRGEVETARKLYDGFQLNWSQVLPGWQAVHVAVRGANGETNLARTLARQIPLDRLKNEEKQLIEPYLN